eukprot:GEMP01000177.1.p1 GENE.GEMP01000177.1~~GEMP01000177.1.p1  ORF type:complete len:2785 (+),score=546.68 GEMP01000177.1:287-8641(+)
MALLTTGDVVLLRVRRNDSSSLALVLSDGIVNDDIGLCSVKDVNHIEDVRDCLFKIIFKLNYNAAKDYQKLQDRGASEVELLPVREKYEKEHWQNKEKMQLREPLSYGETIQLLHLKSNKFVTVQPKVSATTEKESRLVVLQEGGPYSALNISPFYKYKMQGEPVRYDEQISLSVMKLGDKWFLHPSDAVVRTEEDGKRSIFEVNCSTRSTLGFFLALYSAMPDALEFSNVVRLYHSQTEGFLGASCEQKNLTFLTNKPELYPVGTLTKDVYDGHRRLRPGTDIKVVGKQLPVTVHATRDLKRPYLRRLEVENYDDPLNFWSKGLWIVESSNRLHGGAVKWDATVCFRQLGSGRYLSVSQEKEGDLWPVCMKEVPDSDSVFVLEHMDRALTKNASKEISSGRPKALIRFDGVEGHGPLWLTSHGKQKDKDSDNRKPSVTVHFASVRKVRDAMQIDILDHTKGEYVKSATTIQGRKKFYQTACLRLEAQMRETVTDDSLATEYERLLTRERKKQKHMEIYKELMTLLSLGIFYYVRSEDENHNLKGSELVDAALSGTGLLGRNTTRQTISRELKLIDATVEVKDILWLTGSAAKEKSSRAVVGDLSAAAEKRKKGGKMRASALSVPPATPAQSKEATKCLKLLLVLWHRMFQDSRKTENYFEKHHWMGMINDMNGLGLGAAVVFAALVSNNPNLVYKIDLDITERFIEFIRTLGPDQTWLKFLSSICSCRGVAISAKQQQVLRVIYDPGKFASPKEIEKYSANHRDLLLQVRLGDVRHPFSPAIAAHRGNFLGKSCVQAGVQDIMVTWDYIDGPWNIGENMGLYWHPKHLNLTTTTYQGKEWVALQDIVWVMNPERCYHVVHKCTADAWKRAEALMEKDEYEKIRFKALSVLAYYFEGQLLMLAEMCLTRQLNSILAIAKTYTFELCAMGVWHEQLSPSTRRAFTILLQNLWLDRHPQRAIQIPNLIRKYHETSTTNSTSEIALPKFELLDDSPDVDGIEKTEFYTMPDASKFDLLVEYVQYHLNLMEGRMVHSHVRFNNFTGCLMEMLLRLVGFGFMARVDKLQELIVPALLCLDGRSDWMDAPRGLDGQSSCSASKEDSDVINIDANVKTPLLVPSKCAVIRRSRSLANILFPPDEDGQARYKEGEANNAVMQCKKFMCNFLIGVNDIAIDYALTMALQVFQRSVGDIEQSVDHVIEAAFHPDFNFDILANPRDLITILLDLMIYANGELFEAALNLLYARTHRVADVTTKMISVILVVSEKEVAEVDSVKRDVADLGNLFSTHECWGVEDSYGPIDMKRVKHANELCIRLRRLCSAGAPNIDREDPNPEIQHDLRNLGLVNASYEAFSIPMMQLSSHSQDVLKEIMCNCCSLLTQFINDCPENQEAMFPYLELLRKWFNYGVGVSNCIAAIFKNNRVTCEQLPIDLVYDFAKVLHERKRGFLPYQLSFLLSIVKAGERPILRNKQVVIEVLKEERFKNILHLLRGADGRQVKERLIRKFSSWKELQKPEMFRTYSNDDAEIIYHTKSLELLGFLCLGNDRASGGTTYVQSLFPADELAMQFMDLHRLQQSVCDSKTAKPVSNLVDMKKILGLTKGTIMTLFSSGYYETDFKNPHFWNSDIHVRVLTAVIDDVDSLFQSGEPVFGQEEMYVVKALRALNRFVEFCRSSLEGSMKKLVDGPLLSLVKKLSEDKYTVRANNPAFKVITNRAYSLILNEGPKVGRLPPEHFSDAVSPRRRSTIGLAGVQRGEWEAFAQDIKNHPKIVAKTEADHLTMINHILNIAELTDPSVPAYRNQKRNNIDSGKRMTMDIRRNIITLEDIITRCVDHCMNHLDHWEAVGKVLRLLIDILKCVDSEQLGKTQRTIANVGGVKLLVECLMAQPGTNISILALECCIKMLEPNNFHVQDAFMTYFHKVDDSGLWTELNEMYEQCMCNVKHIRGLKMLLRTKGIEAITSDEYSLISMFKRDLDILKTAMRFQQVLCEGHLLKMQNYIFHQLDNSISFNFVERSVEVVLRLCKNEEASNGIDEDEIDAQCQSVDLLIEMLQGPCERNQKFMSVSGLVEGSQKILRGKFDYLCSKDDDPYPESVRQLKAKITLCLLSLLEARQDTEVHKNLMYRLDTGLLKSRLVFVHRYFLSHILKLGNANLDDMGEPDDIVVPAGANLLEDFYDEQIADWFDEAFNLIMLIEQIAPLDDDFKRETRPVMPDFNDDPSLYVNNIAYMKAQRQYTSEMKYFEAYEFFNIWIQSIEIVMQNKLFALYFRKPVLCNFVLGISKRNIVNNIVFSSPEEKAKDFMEMCLSTYDQTLHTRTLSKLQWIGSKCIPASIKRPLHFFLKNDSLYLMKLQEYALILAFIQNLLLLYSMELRDGPDGQVPDVEDPNWKLAIFYIGWFYLSMMLVSFFITFILYFPLYYKTAVAEGAKRGDPRYLATFFFYALLGVIGYVCIEIFGRPMIFALIAAFLCYKISKRWKLVPPNNRPAGLVQGLTESILHQPITRRAFLCTFCYLAITSHYFFYSFLLLDLIFQSAMLQNVIKAVTIPSKSLILTGIVGLIVMYQYAFIAFYFFRADYSSSCSTILDCTTETIYQGLRADIGSSIEPVNPGSANWYQRMGFDLTYFIIITTVLMNVIFGIIIDTFGSLRDLTEEREKYMNNTTFISCLCRQDVDKVASNMDDPNIKTGFHYLENVTQNKWNYMNFIFYLYRKDPTEYTGPETFVRTKLDDEDTGWMPLSRCLLLEGGGLAEEEMDPMLATLGRVEKRLMKLEVLTDAVTMARTSNATYQSSY